MLNWLRKHRDELIVGVIVAALGGGIAAVAANRINGPSSTILPTPVATSKPLPRPTTTTDAAGQSIDYVEVVRSGESFWVTFNGSEVCGIPGEASASPLGSIMKGQTYRLVFDSNERRFDATGPSQSLAGCKEFTRHDLGDVAGQENEDVRLNIWGHGNLQFDPNTGAVKSFNAPIADLGQIFLDDPSQ